MKYLDTLNKSAEETTKESNILVAESARLTLQSRMLEIKKQIAKSKQELEIVKCTIDYNPLKIYNVDSHIQLLERELNYYVKLEQEQF